MNSRLRWCECGDGPPILFVERRTGTFSYFCPECCLHTGEFAKKDDAAKAWNNNEYREEVPF